MRSYPTGLVRMTILHYLMKQNAKHLQGKLFRTLAHLPFSKQPVVKLGRQHRHASLILVIICSLSTRIVDKIHNIGPIDLFVKNTVTIFLHFNDNFKSDPITGTMVIVG